MSFTRPDPLLNLIIIGVTLSESRSPSKVLAFPGRSSLGHAPLTKTRLGQLRSSLFITDDLKQLQLNSRHHGALPMASLHDGLHGHEIECTLRPKDQASIAGL